MIQSHNATTTTNWSRNHQLLLHCQRVILGNTYLKNRLCISLVAALACLSVNTSWAQTSPWETYLNAGSKAYQEAHYTEAETNLLAALKEAENFGPQDIRLGKTLNELARLDEAQGKYGEAEKLYKRSLQIRETALGPNHTDVSASLNHLAILYQEQSKYSEAEPLFKRSLQINEAALGPNLAGSLNNLAGLYQLQGKYAEAEPLYKRSLQVKETALGPNHLDVALSLNNLGSIYQDQGKYAEAEPLYKRSLQILETALGPNHPDVALSLNNLATLYRDQGKYAEAEPLYKRSLQVKETALGPNHPDVALSLNNLAALYKAQGKYAEAEPLYKRSLRIRETASGPNHPDVALSLNNLAALYEAQSKYAEAEPLFKRSLQIRETAFGPNHPDVAQSLNNLAVLYQARGKYVEVERLFKRSLQIRETALGPDHPAVARSMNNLAVLYGAQRKYAEAEPLFKHSLQIWEKCLGSEHPDVATSFYNLAELYRAQGNYAEAEPLHKRALEIREKSLGMNHPDTGQSLIKLALVYKALGKSALAESLLKRSGEILPQPIGNAPVRDKWALVIGINNFSQLPPSLQLHCASKDALNFYNYLTKEANFRKDHVLLLLDDNATKHNIEDAFGDNFLPSVSEPDDIIVVYIATHGTAAVNDKGGRAYIVAHDTVKTQLFSTAVRMDDIYQRIKECVKANRALIIMDTCYSGAGITDGADLPAATNLYAATQIAQGCGHRVITASSPKERSWECLNHQNGVFTKYLLEELRLTHGRIDLHSAFPDLQRKVSSEVSQCFRVSQTPQVGGDWQGNDLILSIPATKPRQVLDPELLRLMKSGSNGAPARGSSTGNHISRGRPSSVLPLVNKHRRASRQLPACSY